jgi:hypothetical protein
MLLSRQKGSVGSNSTKLLRHWNFVEKDILTIGIAIKNQWLRRKKVLDTTQNTKESVLINNQHNNNGIFHCLCSNIIQPPSPINPSYLTIVVTVAINVLISR